MSPKYLVAAVLAAALTAPLSAQSVKAGIDAWQRADYTGAVGIWRPLAEGGDADALFNGDGVPQDRVLAYALVSRAAAQGLEPAKDTLAQLDQLMPVADRQKAVALAQAKAKQAPPPSSKPKPVKVATARAPVVKAPP